MGVLLTAAARLSSYFQCCFWSARRPCQTSQCLFLSPETNEASTPPFHRRFWLTSSHVCLLLFFSNGLQERLFLSRRLKKRLLDIKSQASHQNQLGSGSGLQQLAIGVVTLSKDMLVRWEVKVRDPLLQNDLKIFRKGRKI